MHLKIAKVTCVRLGQLYIGAHFSNIQRLMLLFKQVYLFIREHTFKEKLYDNLRGLVSRYALIVIVKEKTRVEKCSCTIKRTHNLPCSCQLAIMTSIPLTTVDQHWRRLTTTVAPDESQPDMGLSITTELEVIAKMFEEANVPRRKAIKERLREIAYPNQTSLFPPPNKLSTKGRPGELKGSIRRLPSKWENVDNLVKSLQARNSPGLLSSKVTKVPKPRSTKRKSLTSKQSAPKKKGKRMAS
ncbi:uncharacterized protein LOC130720324 [Lotus japonicus]|uniref:uncharacterized protein LOC130720324 n=1 Tax=Lotus japonicus TaxID=34305 RepID=UPI00258D7E6E|nr:uncharacterized protein LOC130720324 [Lotus japonicus]